MKIIINIARAYLKRKHRAVVTTMQFLDRARSIDVFENRETNEYIRLSTLELCAEEVARKALPGAMAEVGVYRGAFASKMNQMFPDKSLYLFDTFEGFDRKQEHDEKTIRGLKHQRDFSDTSIDLVLSRMKNQSSCIIKKGLFPVTADGITDRFCLVSLDADLFQPIYDGLVWFWPRLAKGGFILVHDYNNKNFPGAKSAVWKFSEENGIPYVPVTDVYGSAIFTK